MDLAVMEEEITDMKEVKVIKVQEVLRAEVPVAEDMGAEAPEEGIRKDRNQKTECSSQNAEYFLLWLLTSVSCLLCKFSPQYSEVPSNTEVKLIMAHVSPISPVTLTACY
jgi:hypothetical protein